MKSIFLLGAAAFSLGAAPAMGQQVRVEQGALSGSRQNNVDAFLGIPFAAPPIGDGRWRAPKAPAHWNGIRTANAFGNSCRQDVVKGDKGFGPWTPEYLIAGRVSEDCLYLNVWTPTKRTGAKLPILFWIHGGGFVQGSADVPIYNGAALAEKGIIVVSVNYRLGVYGFLNHPGLAAENPEHVSGNYGLLDQMAALRWVQRNIAAFGGDPARVTIAGQSAGSAAVHDLILSPKAKGLFHQAIAQSGSGMNIRLTPRADAERNGIQLATAAGATTIAQLRSLPPEQIDSATRKSSGTGLEAILRFSPSADGVVLPLDPAAAIATGAYNDTPILTGLTADEGSSMTENYRPGEADYRAYLARRFGASAPKFESVYPAIAAATSGPEVGRDSGIASLLFWADERRKTTKFPIYAYLFTHVEPGPDAGRYGAFHSSEIPYVFGTLGTSKTRPFGDDDRAVSALMSQYWVNYIKAGNPNGSGPAWPRLDDSGKIMEINKHAGARSALTAERLKLYRAYVKGGGEVGLF